MEKNLETVKGRIFDIQKFSVHDGPGIRTIVFLKGCILRCKWCCNPESQEYEIQQMKQAGEITTIGTDVTAGEVMADVKKDMPYYRRSGGGLTLSGGETFCQPDFAHALFCLAKQSGINTAVETTVATDWSNIEKSIDYIDNFLIDIKHTNSEKHKAYTGVGTEKIVENIIRVVAAGKNVTVRVPTIPGFNDTEDEIASIARLTVALGVKEMHLLPYHKLGYDKYIGLEREYPMGDATPPAKHKMELLRACAQRQGVDAVIGG